MPTILHRIKAYLFDNPLTKDDVNDLLTPGRNDLITDTYKREITTQYSGGARACAVNAASPTMNAGGVTPLCMCKTPKGQRLPAFAGKEEHRLPPDKSGGYSQDTPDGVSQCGNKQVVRISKPRRGNTLLTGCFSFRLRQVSLVAQPRRGDTLLIRRQAYHSAAIFR